MTRPCLVTNQINFRLSSSTFFDRTFVRGPRTSRDAPENGPVVHLRQENVPTPGVDVVPGGSVCHSNMPLVGPVQNVKRGPSGSDRTARSRRKSRVTSRCRRSRRLQSRPRNDSWRYLRKTFPGSFSVIAPDTNQGLSFALIWA